MHQPEKVGTVRPSSDTGTTHVTLVTVPCCQLSYIPYVFKHCDLLVLKIIILWEAVRITLYSQNPNTTFNIKFWFFTHGLRRAGSFENRVIPSKLTKRGWKYPLKHQERGEGTPLKDSKLGAQVSSGDNYGTQTLTNVKSVVQDVRDTSKFVAQFLDS